MPENDVPDLKMVTLWPTQPVAKIKDMEKARGLPRTMVGYFPHPQCPKCEVDLEQSRFVDVFPGARITVDEWEWIVYDYTYINSQLTGLGVVFWCNECGDIYARTPPQRNTDA